MQQRRTELDLAGIRAKSTEDQKDTGFVRGTTSSDTYNHATGDGTYRIQETDDFRSGSMDQFVFSDLNAADVTFGQNAGGDLVMTAGADTITVTDHFSAAYEAIETISFADGVDLDLAGISGKVEDDAFIF